MGSMKDFSSLQDSHTESYEENVFYKMHQKTNFDGEWFTI